jgi:hypothetical protein
VSVHLAAPCRSVPVNFNVRRHMSDSLTRAVQTFLWPFLKSEGFRKLTARKFVRERSRVFQQLWVDANGIAGKKSTRIVLCASLPFGPAQGYLDPHGFLVSNGRSWPTNTEELADASMQQVVVVLNSNALGKLDEISSVEKMLSLLEKDPRSGWHTTYTELHRRWKEGDAEVLAVEASNRKALKL